MMKGNSNRHHYIPKFLINGFSNSEGTLYIYDKQKDEIKIKPRNPKSLFFEEGRNTVHIKEEQYSSIIEDYMYQNHDDISSKVVKKTSNRID